MAEENKGRVFTGKDVSEYKKTMDVFQKSGGTAPVGNVISNIKSVEDTFKEVRNLLFEEVVIREKEIDPERDTKKEAYDFFSPVITKNLPKFKERLEKGESIEEVEIKEKAASTAAKITNKVNDLTTRPISEIVSKYVSINDIQFEDAYDTINEKVQTATGQSLADLMSFYRQTDDLVKEGGGAGMDQKALKETLDKHNILLNSIGVILKEMGIKNPAFEEAEKNLEKSLSEVSSRSVEGVKETVKSEKESKEISKETLTEKTETKTLESVKTESKITETVKAPETGTEKPPLVVTTPMTAIKTETAPPAPAAPEIKTESLPIEGVGSKETEVKAPKESPKTGVVESKPVVEKTVIITPTEAAKSPAEATKPTVAEAPKSIEQVGGAEAPKSIEQVGGAEAPKSIEQAGGAETPATEAGELVSTPKSLLEQLGLGNLLGFSEPGEAGVTSTGTAPTGSKETTPGAISKASPISIESIKEQKSSMMTQISEKTGIAPKVESSPLKMSKEIPQPQTKQSGEQSTSASTPKGEESGSSEIGGEISSSESETKSESTVKSIESPNTEGNKGSDVDSGKDTLNAILSVMQEIRETLNGPLIVMGSGNKFD